MDAQTEMAASHSDFFASARRPFVGLRSFAFEDAPFYFGRTEQIDALEQLLLTSQLISVVGSSGSGKSSLVRAGLLPRFTSDPMFAGETWTWVEMRPGDAPIRNLADALARPNQTAGQSPHDALAEARADRIELRLLESSFGIRDSLELLDDAPSRQLVILVDQFEEIFRFADLREQRGLDARQAAAQRDEATLFIQLLLAATNDPGCPCRIILTMRSDFIGECARFHGLAEAVTASQYLVPSLTRDQRAESICGPIEAAGGSIDRGLVQRLLNETNEDLDQLPVLQHAMMRCWQHAVRRDAAALHLTLEDYAAIGGIRNALAQHADEVLAELQHIDSTQAGGMALQDVARRIFQCLTDTDRQGRTIRRPQTLGALTDVLAADDAPAQAVTAAEHAVRLVVAHFSHPDCSFLRAPASEEMTRASVIDIGHEALIRRWERLGGADSRSWVREEQQDAEHYSDLVRQANFGSLIEDVQLQISESWWRERRPNRSWARRYARGENDGISAAHGVLQRSRAVIERRHRAERRRRRIHLIVAITIPVVATIVVAALSAVQQQKQQRELVQAQQAQGRLISMLGMEALRLVDPHSALLVALYGLNRSSSTDHAAAEVAPHGAPGIGPWAMRRLGLAIAPLMRMAGQIGPWAVRQLGLAEVDGAGGSDVPELSRLAYAAMGQLRERRIIHVGNSFMGLGFNSRGDMLTYSDETLRVLEQGFIATPKALTANRLVWMESGKRLSMPYASNIEVSADDSTVLLANSLQTFVTDPHQPYPYELLAMRQRRNDAPGAASPQQAADRDTDSNAVTPDQESVGVGTMSRDGSLILTAKRNDIVRLWRRDPTTAKFTEQTGLEPTFSDGRPVREGTAVAISADGRYLAVGTAGGRIHIFGSTGESGRYAIASSLSYPRSDIANQVWMLTFDPADSRLLLAAYQSSVPYLWHAEAWQEGEATATALKGGQGAFRVAFSADGRLIAAPAINLREVDVWQTAMVGGGDGEPAIRIHTGETFFQIGFDSNGWLAGGSQDGYVWLWDLRPALSRGPIAGASVSPRAAPPPTTATWDPADAAYIIRSTDPQVHATKIDPRDWLREQPSATISPDGLWLLLTPKIGFIALYDLRRADGDAVATFGGSDDTWSGPATFAPPAVAGDAADGMASREPRVAATTGSGEPMIWHYFPTKPALIAFACRHLPIRMNVMTTGEDSEAGSHTVTLPPDVQEELTGQFWPALKRLMADREEAPAAVVANAATGTAADPPAAPTAAVCQ